jgi:diacylglycerol kinase family enzyme
MGLLLVGNPTAQSGRNEPRIRCARELLDEAGLSHVFLATQPAGGTVEAVRRALIEEPYDTAVYMGGDGTFAEVAKGILASGREVRLGMLPTGTANDQGKSFGLDSADGALERNVRVIAQGHETRLDAGRIRSLDQHGAIVHEDHFFDSAGWGISPRVLQLRNEDRKAIESIPILRDLYRDQLVYAGAMLRTFLESYVEDDKFDVDLVADGRHHGWTGLVDLVIKGTRIYGGLWVFDPQSRHDDGKFEVCPFFGKRDWVSKALVALDDSGKLKQGLAAIGVEHSADLSASHIELTLHPHDGGLPLYAQIDGEELPAASHAQVDVLPCALRIIVPSPEEIEITTARASQPAP